MQVLSIEIWKKNSEVWKMWKWEYNEENLTKVGAIKNFKTNIKLIHRLKEKTNKGENHNYQNRGFKR